MICNLQGEDLRRFIVGVDLQTSLMHPILPRLGATTLLLLQSFIP
jgi:hypothetical protein